MNTYTMLNGLLQIAPKQDIRYYLNGVLLTSDYLAATNGNYLVKVDNKTGGVLNNIIIDRFDLAIKLKLFTKKNPPILQVKTINGEQVPCLDEYELKTVDGNFPDINRVIFDAPQKSYTAPLEIGLDLKLLAVLSKAIDVISDHKISGAKFTFSDCESSVKIEKTNITGVLMPCRL